MTRPKTFPLRPSRMAQDLAGLAEVLDELIINNPHSSSAVVATVSATRVYASELALFFTDQPLTQERELEALEARWLERVVADRNRN